MKTNERVSRIASKLFKPAFLIVLNGSHRVRAIIEYDDQVLLVKNRFGSHKWSLPGGGVNKGETNLEAVIRELHEELRLHITTDMPRQVYEGTYQPGKRFHFHVVGYHIPVESTAYEIDPHEILDAGWFPLDSLPEDLSPIARQVLDTHTPKK